MGALPSTGFFTDCLDLTPLTGWMPQLSQELEMKDSVTVAELGITPDDLEPRVNAAIQSEVQLPPGSFSVRDVKLMHVPILTVDLAAGGKAYRKIVQAATAKMIWDDTAKCSYCEHPSEALCETCWGTVCQEHENHCGQCGKPVCSNCVMSKGFRNKTMLCVSCKNRA